ncbi:MAG: hypothetical protein U0X91_21720 [Spirosomataceae bacterium]
MPLSHHTSAYYPQIVCSAHYSLQDKPEFAAENVGYFTSPYAERAKVGKPVVDYGKNQSPLPFQRHYPYGHLYRRPELHPCPSKTLHFTPGQSQAKPAG